VSKPQAEALDAAARTAWRDGRATLDLIETATGRWSGEVARAGRGEDYLVWRFTPVNQRDLVAEMVQHIGGKVGRALARESIQAAVVAPDGRILAGNTAFASRAAGKRTARLPGPNSWPGSARTQERIYYAREGQGHPGAPSTAGSRSGRGHRCRSSHTASLFILLDNQGGVGDARTGCRRSRRCWQGCRWAWP
jgi:two-component system cell cycle sensor histidine kinase/response regulator CckA